MAKDQKPEQTDVYWLGVIAKALSYLSLRAAELHEQDVAKKAEFLMSLGLTRDDAAEVLHTTAETVRVSIRQAKTKKGGKKRGKPREG